MIHICFVTNEYPPAVHGGVGTFVQTLARKLVVNGFKISVVGVGADPNRESIVDDEGVSVYSVRASKWSQFKFIQNIRRVNRKLGEINETSPIHIVETAELGQAFISKRFTFKRVIRMHGGHHFFSTTLGNPISKWKAFQEKKSFRRATHIAAVSNFVGETTRDLLQLSNRKIEVIYNPIETSKFYLCDPTKIVKGRILFVGTICEKKGVRQLIQALPEIVKFFPQAHLEIVGRDWFDPITKESYTDYLKTQIPESVKGKVNIIGKIPHTEVPTKIEEAEVCAYPSHMEAMPIAWLEVMAMGKPFVASLKGPGPETVSDGVTGLLADCYIPESIAEKIKFMFSYPEKASEMGLRARKDVLERFNLDDLVSQNISFYSKVLER